LTHRGSILKEKDSLFDCGIDRDIPVFVTLEFKPQMNQVYNSSVPKQNILKDLQYPLPPKEGYVTKPSFSELLKMNREELRQVNDF